MPLYEYECDACGQRFELLRRFSDPAVDICAVCGKGPVRRLLSSPAIQFKGSGWYITDYARKAQTEKTTGEKTKPADGKADTAPAAEKTAKSDTKTKSAPSSTTTSSESKS